ncbi:TIM-barrel domain-containing protein [Cryptosporangium arvum]|uniref:TIM-barrel domain-containing protein n=1 Tax=Cryptosporangium arvum TaxID=80871 RepID=UPI0004BB6896|nr:TIM-barrel domain-containing protein [Cryptosporangium arvum]
MRRLVEQGVDCFKTDFGERIPLDVRWSDGADPDGMHNRYAQLYNEAVADVLSDARGAGDVVLFARSATTGGQRLPVHWGGDSTSTFASMAETLRGGLSLALSGFGFWSHDIGGFEGTPDPTVFVRWVQFGLLSSHSRLHGSGSYRVPYAFGDEAERITREFLRLRYSLMPYLWATGRQAAERGLPVIRPMALEFPDDPGAAYCDRQYMLGADLLVCPVFDPDGAVEYYLPPGRWTDWWTGDVTHGPAWRTDEYPLDRIPLWVRGPAVIPMTTRVDRPDHEWLDSLELRVFPAGGGAAVKQVTVTDEAGREATWQVTIDDEFLAAVGADGAPEFSFSDAGQRVGVSREGRARLPRRAGTPG